MGATWQPDHTVRSVAPRIAGRELLMAEANALLSRLNQVQPFELTMPMVSAALPSKAAQQGIHQLIKTGRIQLRRRIVQYIRLLRSRPSMTLEQCQAAYSLLKLQFNSLLDQFDIFADVVNQRSEHDTGIWIAGLDALAEDTLRIEGQYYQAPPLICYLDRGHGAAIRRARTRLPGGKFNPVAIIRVPRERMVGSGIGSSLVHEVGHQGAALLDLVASLKGALQQQAARDSVRRKAWQLFELWISEIISDIWSVGTLGISATAGLINVVSLPSYFVFRLPDGDPHPFPWIRVKISLAFGKALYPDPQWARLEQVWEHFYPTAKLPPVKRELVEILDETLSHFVRLVLEHRPKALRGKSLWQIFPVAARQPARLRAVYRDWQQEPDAIYRARPGLVFAAVGQARADQTISPFEENKLLSQVLRQWALMKNVHHLNS
jgi:hypothetical protein